MPGGKYLIMRNYCLTLWAFLLAIFMLFFGAGTSSAGTVCPFNVKHLESGMTFVSLQEAYNNAVPEGFATLLVADSNELYGDVVFHSGLDVILEGGYDCDFISRSGVSEVHGNMVIQTGLVSFDRIVIASSTPPRFTDNRNGTITDNSTGLVWLKNANCFGLNNFSSATSVVDSLADGSCGLTDGSQPGDWRLPEENNAAINEWSSLVDTRFSSPAFSNTAGTGQWSEGDAFSAVVADDVYWSRNIVNGDPENIRVVTTSNGAISTITEMDFAYVWPVKAPRPRFTDNGNGTITDNNTGLIWLKNANCFGYITFSQALSDVDSLADGECGLTDGSQPGDWRLPEENLADINEWSSLIDTTFTRPVLSNTAGIAQWSEGDAFTGVKVLSAYWSGTEAYLPQYAHVIWMDIGLVSMLKKDESAYAWPVKDPQ